MSAPIKSTQVKNIQAETAATSPFQPDNPGAYLEWRRIKLANAPSTAADLLVPIRNPAALSADEHEALTAKLQKYNMAVYECATPGDVDKEVIRLLGGQFGLQRLDPNMLADDDGITSLQTEARKSDRGYIPYSDKRLLWHTDGYYNSADHQIRGMILYCAQDASSGGENQLLDHELVYLIVRDTNPQFIDALMQPQVMTIPANTEAGGEMRPAQSGPVFSIDSETGNLHMRYTARTKSIEWEDDAITRKAVECLESILAENRHVIHHRMSPGQGLICNNVLHNRTAFKDGPESGKSRLVYRARYYDRISNTDWHEWADKGDD